MNKIGALDCLGNLKAALVVILICLWRQFVEVAMIYFKNVKIVIDKINFILQDYVFRALEKVRKRVQNELSSKRF